MKIDWKYLKYLVHCPNLVEIDLETTDYEDQSDNEIQYLLEMHPNARNFQKIVLMKDITWSELLAIATLCPNIIELGLNFKDDFDDEDIDFEKVCFGKLKVVNLDLTENGFRTHEEMSKILDCILIPAAVEIASLELDIRNLRYEYGIYGSFIVRDENLRFKLDKYLIDVSGKAPFNSLEKLTLNYKHKELSAESLKKVSDHFPKLRHLIIEPDPDWPMTSNTYEKTFINDLKMHASSRNYDMKFDLYEEDTDSDYSDY